MTSLTIELPDDRKAALAAKAQAKRLSAQQYGRLVIEYDLAPERSHGRGKRRPRTVLTNFRRRTSTLKSLLPQNPS